MHILDIVPAGAIDGWIDNRYGWPAYFSFYCSAVHLLYYVVVQHILVLAEENEMKNQVFGEPDENATATDIVDRAAELGFDRIVIEHAESNRPSTVRGVEGFEGFEGVRIRDRGLGSRVRGSVVSPCSMAG